MRKKQKKLSCLILCILCITLCGCSKKTEKKEVSLYNRGLEVIEIMNEMVHSELYGTMGGASEEIKQLATTLQDWNYTAPTNVYQVSIPEDMLTGMMILMQMDTSELKDMSPTFKECLNKKMQSSIPIEMNASYGSIAVATAAFYSTGKSFVSKEATKDILYVYLYEKSYPVIVQFTVSEDHVVNASGCFLMSNEYEDSVEGIKKMFMNEPLFGGSTIEKITKE